MTDIFDIIAFNRSKILKAFLKPEKTTIASAPEEATEKFESYMYYTKIDFKFVTEDIREKNNEVNRILRNTNFNEIYSKSTKNNITKIIQLPIDSYRNVMSKLKQLPDLEFAELKKSEETTSIEQLRKRLQEEENNKKQIRTEQYINEAKRWEDLKKKDDIIASLNNEIMEKEKSQKYVLAKIDISRILSGDVGIAKSLKIFGITFIESFVFITIGLFVCYLIIIGLTRLFVILGIKTRSGSSSRYGRYVGYGSSSYGYGDYNYGYGEKRIKRKYIRKPKHKDKDSESDESNKTDAK